MSFWAHLMYFQHSPAQKYRHKHTPLIFLILCSANTQIDTWMWVIFFASLGKLSFPMKMRQIECVRCTLCNMYVVFFRVYNSFCLCEGKTEKDTAHVWTFFFVVRLSNSFCVFRFFVHLIVFVLKIYLMSFRHSFCRLIFVICWWIVVH